MAQQRDPDGRRAEQLGGTLPLDGGEHGRRVRAGQDHARRAEVDVDGEEAVQLRAVVHRQGVHLDVVGRHPAVDHAADVLRDERAAGQHHALGPRLGTGGVHQPQRVVVADRDLGIVLRSDRPPVVDVLPPVRRAADPTAGATVDAGRRQRRLRGGDEGILGDHPGGPGVPQDERHLVRAEHEVHRHERRRAWRSRTRAPRTATSCGPAGRAGRPCRGRVRRARARSGSPRRRTRRR